MKDKDILKLEEDDESKMGINGKQVFFTKRINGKTTHNKEKSENTTNFAQKERVKRDENFIEIKASDIKKIENNPKPVNNINKKKKRKKKKNKKVIIARIITIQILILIIAIFAILSPIFNITKIVVDGENKITKDTIISLSGIEEGNNIFKVSINKAINNIKENPYINKAEIKRILPGTVQIVVKERTVAYQIKVIDSYVYIDYQGYILEESTKNDDVPIVEGLSTEQETLLNGKRVINKDIENLRIMQKIMNVAKSEEIAKNISKIKIENGEYILELSKDKKTVYLGDGSDIRNKMVYLRAILEKEKGNKGKIFLNGILNNGFKPYFREE